MGPAATIRRHASKSRSSAAQFGFACLMLLLLATGGCAGHDQTWHRSELFFGGNRPDGTPITDVEWKSFVDRELTPAFPAGLTIIPASGQWREEDGSVTRETSRIVILFYPSSAQRSADMSIRELVNNYCHTFHQDSVLRADSTQRVSFPTSQSTRR